MARRDPRIGIAAAAAVVLAALVVVAAVPGEAVPSPLAGTAKKPRVIASDTAANPSPLPFWGRIECQKSSRHELIETGGDPHPTITGAPQGNTAFRRLRVLDGDEFYGERCELGLNNRNAPTAFYRERQRRRTGISLRLPPGFPLNTPDFQVVSQMKQTNPAANAGGSPMLELQVFLGRWKLIQSAHRGLTSDSRELWSAPARTGVWTRFVFDIRYSRRPKKGFVKVLADVNGDGDYRDSRERSGHIRTFTLKTEGPGGFPDGLKPGASIPSHLRAGIYHDPAISCPAPAGCQLDIDNIQVQKP